MKFVGIGILVIAFAASMAHAESESSSLPRYDDSENPPVPIAVFASNPQGLSVSFLSGFTVNRWNGFFITAEPGLHGGKLSVGRGQFGPHSSYRYLSASVIRTWNDPWGVEPGETLVGIEGSGGWVLNFRAGVYREIGSGPDDWLFSIGVGIQLW